MHKDWQVRNALPELGHHAKLDSALQKNTINLVQYIL